MPSKKGSIAYENRLARRRAQRAIGKLEKQLNSGALSRAEESQVRYKISAMREDIAATYIGRRGHEVQSREEAARAAKRLSTRDYDRESYDRESVDFTASNKRVAAEITHPYYTDPVTKQHLKNPMSSFSEGEAKTFWRATQNLWDRQDVPYNKRFEAVIKAVAEAQGIDPSEVDLRELMDAIINDKSSNAKDWEAALQKDRFIANGGDIGQDEVQDFSSEDVAKYETEKNIAEVLEEYRQRYGAQNEAQEE